MIPLKKRSRINSERNCSHCLYYRGIEKAVGGDIGWGRCLADGTKDITRFHGTTCENWKVNPKNPLSRYKPSEDEKEAISYLRKRYSSSGRRPLSIKREKEYPKLNIKTPLIKSKKKQKLQLEILSDNIEVRKLLDALFKLPKRSKGEGRKIRRQLRKLGFYLSKNK